jgi:hypothetical protein
LGQFGANQTVDATERCELNFFFLSVSVFLIFFPQQFLDSTTVKVAVPPSG